MIGDGPLRDALALPAEKARVELLGSRSDVAEQMRRADLMIFPSRPEGEGMPGVLIEAGLSGLPVVATAVPGVRVDRPGRRDRPGGARGRSRGDGLRHRRPGRGRTAAAPAGSGRPPAGLGPLQPGRGGPGVDGPAPAPGSIRQPALGVRGTSDGPRARPTRYEGRGRSPTLRHYCLVATTLLGRYDARVTSIRSAWNRRPGRSSSGPWEPSGWPW